MVNLLLSGRTHSRMRVPTFYQTRREPVANGQIRDRAHQSSVRTAGQVRAPKCFQKEANSAGNRNIQQVTLPRRPLNHSLTSIAAKNKRPPYALRLRLGHSSIRIDGKCFIFNSNKYEITALLHLSLIMPISVFFVSFRQFLSFMQFLPECLYSGKVVLFTF